MLAYLDCFSGISGDMLLGALLDAGVELEALRSGLAALPLTGYTLTAEPVAEHGLRGTRARVTLDEVAAPEHRGLREIEALLHAAALAPRVRTRALAIFRRLAEAEAEVHGVSVEAVEFHEVGAVDAVVDIVGSALGLELLGVEALYCSELPLTSGRVQAAHGMLPVPAPATVALLRGTAATWRPLPAEGELVTPTGAAVVAALARFERPALSLRAVGHGFGTRALPWANCLRLLLGSVPAAGSESTERDEICVLETNLDAMTGEALGWLLERVLAEGALDASYTPAQMKKNRPGTLLRVLARPEDAERLAALLLRESTTLGVRLYPAERRIAGRREERIATALGPARVKVKLLAGRVVAVAPEYEDCRALAEAHHLPLAIVMDLVRRAGERHVGLEEQ